MCTCEFKHYGVCVCVSFCVISWWLWWVMRVRGSVCGCAALMMAQIGWNSATIWHCLQLPVKYMLSMHIPPYNSLHCLHSVLPVLPAYTTPTYITKTITAWTPLHCNAPYPTPLSPLWVFLMYVCVHMWYTLHWWAADYGETAYLAIFSCTSCTQLAWIQWL